jgi:leucyl aminopeptidase (aminopeptidase T)
MESLTDGAKTVVTHCLNIKPYEKVSIITDRKLLKIGQALYDACREVNFDTVLIVMEPTGRDGAEPPAVVAQAMKASNIVIAPTFYSMTHTKARIEAGKAGAKVLNMPDISEFSFTKGGLTADYWKVKKSTEKMFYAVKHAHNIEVKSENGTDVTFSVENREWQKDTGIIHKPSEIGNLPGGEVFIAPVENSINGTIVFDSFKLSDNGLKLTVKEGKVVKTVGNAEKLMKIFDELGEKAKQIAEFGIGTNYKAKIIGNTLEDEKVLGSVHFALGSNISFGGKNKLSFHKDGVIASPTVKVDNKLIIENGKWKI